MKESKHSKAYLIIGFIFIILVTHVPVIYTMFYHSLTGAPAVLDGSTDLSQISLEHKVVLDGKWEFYWKRMIATEPIHDDKPDFLIKVPDYWSKYKIDGSWLPAIGYGSYRLMLKGIEYTDPVTVYIPDFGSAYRIFIDGKLTSESGIISENNESLLAVPQSKLYPVTISAEKEHEVVIEVATTKFSGLYMAPVLKDYKLALQEDSDRDNIRFILFGTVLFSFFAIIVLYILSFGRSKNSNWLPAIGVFVILRIMLTTEFYSFWQSKLFFNLSYEAINELMFLVTFVLKFLLIFMLQDQFGILYSKKEKFGFLFYYLALYIVFLFIPKGIYNRHLTIILPVASFALELYSFLKIYFNSNHLKKYSILTYWGVILAISGLIIDSYYINGNIYFNMSLSLLTLLSAYLMIIIMVYALNITDVFNDLAVSSSLLAQARNQIVMQKEYYDNLSEQINEIRSIKHDIRHFIGVTKRLSDEERYDNLKLFLSEYSEKIETGQLPVFCENIVANSILGFYSLKAKKDDILFNSTCSIQSKLSISDSDLCVVLGNALENAIEACGNLDNSSVRFISIEARTINGHMLLKIENSYNGYLKMKDEIYLSTKIGEFRGMGMKNIKNVMKSCGGFIKTDHNEKVFTLMAAFPNPCSAEEV